MARLLVAEQIARAANVEVVAGELEAGAEAVEIGEHLQALVGAFADHAVGGGGEIGVGAGLRSADATAQLIELGKAETVGAVDDEGVGRGDVEPAFDDRGRQQHVIFAVVKGAHPLLDLGRGHLAMGGDRADLGDFLAQPLLDVGEVGDARDDVKALPAAIMFAQQRFADDDGIARGDIGADRQAIDRRRLDHRQLAQARHRHLQRARDRGGGEGEDMDVGAEGFQPLLVGDPEMLLFVDNDQPQLLELDAFREEGVGADDDVHRAILEPFAGPFRLGRRDQPREAADLDREAFEALGEIVEMLAGEESRRPDQRDLVAGHGGGEGGAQGNLGLAEPDVAADQPVHRRPLGEIVEHVADRPILVLGLLIGEAVDERGVGAVNLDQCAGAGGADRSGLDEVARNLADAILHPALAALPCLAAQSVERGLLTVGAAVAGEDVDILDRHVELVAPGIFERDAVVGRLADLDRGQALIAGNAMISVDDEVARSEGGEFGQEGVGRLAALLAADESVAEHVLLGQDGDVGGGEAMVEREHEQGRLGLAAKCFLPRFDLFEPVETMVGKEAGEAFTSPARIAGKDQFML